MPIVILDAHAGFCYGVKRALELARKLKEDNDIVYTDGPLIHNETMVRQLEEQGICSCTNPLSISKNPKTCLLIRAHGVSPERRCWLKSLNLSIADATCPDVGKIAGTILNHARKGYTILIYGSPNHPEAIGLLGYANEYSKGFIISNLSDAQKLSLTVETPICLVSQSTMSVQEFEKLAYLLKQLFPQIIVKDTICKNTRLRQESLLQLIQKHQPDCAIIVGSTHSSNTKKLVELAQQHVKTYSVETIADLELIDLSKIKKIVVSAGASTPPDVIQSIATKANILGFYVSNHHPEPSRT